VAVVVEAFTLAARFGAGLSAVEFNRTAPLWMQAHHMFWSLPILIVVPLVWKRTRISGALIGVAAGLIISDLAHHFLILPLLVGHTGWHWP
jgi:hypothetical protein